MKSDKILPKTFFYTGISIMPAFLFCSDFYTRLLLLAFVIAINLSTGRKIRIAPNIILLIAVVLANLYPPGGRILFSVKSFYVTQEALFTGIKKSVLLIGSVYISRFAIRREMIFPGAAGRLLYRTFYYFEKMSEMKINFNKSLITQIDSRLVGLGVTESQDSSLNHSFSEKSDFPNTAFFVSVTFLFWAAFAFSEIYLGRS